MTALAAKVDAEIADLPLSSQYPEGIWKMPIELGIALAVSVFPAVIKERFDRGDRPLRDCVVFCRDGKFYVCVEFEFGDRHPALVMPLDVWPWPRGAAVTPVFGKRLVVP